MLRAKPGVPSLNLKKVSSVDKADALQLPGSLTTSKRLSSRDVENDTSRSLRNVLDRNSYREYISNKGKIVPTELTEKDFPKLVEYREAAIEYRKKGEEKSLDRLKKQNKISPRTYDRRRKEIEVWVTKEEEEAKKSKKVFEEEWRTTTKMISQS